MMQPMQMPPIIYGTAWKKERTAPLVVAAVLAGFRAIDTACQPKHYAEDQVGVALKELRDKHGIGREQLFLQTKFTSPDGQDPARMPYDRNAPLADQVRASMTRSLANLGVERVDSLLLHGPMRTMEENRVVWRTFEELHAQGKTARIGLSNCYDARTLRALFDAAERVKPSVLQNRFHARSGYDREVRAFCSAKGIAYQSFWTLTANPHALGSPVVRELAARRGVTPEQLFFRFTMDLGITPLSGTTNKTHMEQDVAVPSMAPLSAQEIEQIEAVLYAGN